MTEPTTAKESPLHIGALVSLSLPMLLSSLGTSIANVALPSIAQAFHCSFQGAQWIVVSYLLATTTLMVSAGRLGDLIGRRRLLIAGMALFTASSVVCGAASTLWVLIAARVAQGLGAAAMMSLSVALVSDLAPREKTGVSLGLLGTMSAIGTALGPSLGGLLIAAVSWRAIFYVNVPLGILAVFLALRFLPTAPRMPHAEKAHFDILGTLLLAITLAAYSFAMTSKPEHFGALNASLLGLAVLSAGLLIRVEAKAPHPLLRLSAFRDVKLRTSLAMNVLVSTVLMATLVIGPFYLSLALGQGAAQTGIIMTIGPIVAALTGVPAGRLVDRRGAEQVTILGLSGIAIGCALLALLPASVGIPGYLLPMVLVTASYAMFQAANNTAVMMTSGSSERGVISGLMNLSRNIGLISGATIMGAVFTTALGTSKIQTAPPQAISYGFALSFGVAALLMTGAIAIAYAGRRAPHAAT